MRPDESDLSYLQDMLSAAEAVIRFVEGKTLEDYTADLLLRSAVERQIEIIGEAARKVSTELKDKHPAIPWDKIIRQRHVLAHDYGEIQHERIWRVATIHIPQLIPQLKSLLPRDAGS